MANLFVCPFCAHETVTFDRLADCYRCVFCNWRCGAPEHKRRFLGVPLDIEQSQIDGQMLAEGHDEIKNTNT